MGGVFRGGWGLVKGGLVIGRIRAVGYWFGLRRLS